MSNWQDDTQVMAALNEWLRTQQKPLNTFMENIMEYSDDSPTWGLMVVYGKFVMFYNVLMESGDCEINEAFAQALANIANDPLTQAIVGNMLGGMMNRGAGLE